MINIQGCFGFYNDGIQISRQDNLMKDILFLYCNMESITFCTELLCIVLVVSICNIKKISGWRRFIRFWKKFWLEIPVNH